ncbi:unnamed protein product [Callosobruchus maculatus]|nr:unnamed protein product [Callosobruchus maculatus]
MPFHTPEEARYFRRVSYLDELNRGRMEGRIENYPWLVSISVLKHKEEPRSMEFRCTGIAIDLHLVLTGESCFDGLVNRKYVASDFRIRQGSNYFFKKGKTRLANTMGKPHSEDAVYSHMYLLSTDLQFLDKAHFPDKKFEEENATQAKFVAVGWGGALVATRDVSAKSRFFIDEWSTKNMCSEEQNCHNSIKHENMRPQDIDEDETCCQLGILNFDVNATRGSLTGKPLVNVADGKIVGFQYDVKVDPASNFGYSTIFVPMSEEDRNNILTNKNDSKYQPSSKSLSLYRRTFKRAYLRNWLRHTVEVAQPRACNSTTKQNEEDPTQVFEKP